MKSVSTGRCKRTIASTPKKRQRMNITQARRKNKPSQDNQQKQTGTLRTERVKCRRQNFEQETDEGGDTLFLLHTESHLYFFLV